MYLAGIRPSSFPWPLVAIFHEDRPQPIEGVQPPQNEPVPEEVPYLHTSSHCPSECPHPVMPATDREKIVPTFPPEYRVPPFVKVPHMIAIKRNIPSLVIPSTNVAAVSPLLLDECRFILPNVAL